MYPYRFAFVAKDIDGLRRSFVVREAKFHVGGKWLLPLAFILQLWQLASFRIRGGRIVFIHFAGYHSLLPVLLGFRVHIIIAGSDACSFPVINYGNFRKAMFSKAIAYSLQHANTILPVHASLERFSNTYSDLGPVDQGFARFVKGLRTPVIPITYGFDADYWDPRDTPEVERAGVLCVAAGARYGDAVFLRKGLDLIIGAATKMPGTRFTIIGAVALTDYVVPVNVEVIGRVSHDVLKERLAHSSIYCQVSVMEGFPNALCEAMLMECLPVTSSMTSMPEIVDGNGVVISERDVAKLQIAITELLSLSGPAKQELRHKARGSIRSRFPEELRLQQLAALVTNGNDPR